MANLNLTQIVHMATSHVHAKLKKQQHWAPLVNGEKGER